MVDTNTPKLAPLGGGGRTFTFEVMRALKKEQAKAFQIQPGIMGEVRLIERAFGLGPDMISEVFDHHRGNGSKVRPKRYLQQSRVTLLLCLGVTLSLCWDLKSR